MVLADRSAVGRDGNGRIYVLALQKPDGYKGEVGISDFYSRYCTREPFRDVAVFLVGKGSQYVD